MPLRKLALLAGAASFGLAAPVGAQHQGHSMMPGMSMPGMMMSPAQKKAPAKKKPAPKKSAAKPAPKKGASKKPSAKTQAAKKAPMKGHEGHDMSSTPGMTMPSGHDLSTVPEQKPAKGHEGHDMSTMPGTSMPGHDMGTMATAVAEGTDLPAGDAPAPPVPSADAADAVYGAEAMQMGRHHLKSFHGGQKQFQVLNNLTEYQARKGRDGYEWNSEAWYGGDIDRLWLKSEGDGTFGEPVERAEVQALYSRAIDPYVNLHGGLRYDFKPNPSRIYATIGVEGLAPSFFDIEGALFLSNKGEVMARAEGFYDQRITQRLILQPRVELNLAAQNSRSIGVGAGLSDAEIGLRLRYDIRREFAPYIGVQYQRAFGRTRIYLREAGEKGGGWQFVSGIRTWF